MTKPTLYALAALTAIAAMLFMAGPMMAEVRTAVLTVPDMECGSKEIQADMALKGLAGVMEVELDTFDTTATVTFDDATVSVEDMKLALDKFDMPVADVSYPPED